MSTIHDSNQPPPRKRTLRERLPKIIGYTVAVLFILGIIGALLPAEEPEDDVNTAAVDDSTPTQTASPTPSPSPSPSKAEATESPKPKPKPKPKAPADRLNDAVSDAVDGAEVSDESGGGMFVVEFPVSDNLKNSWIRTGAEDDTMAIAKAAYDSGVKFDGLGIRGTFPLVDNLGNESQGQVIWSYWPRTTLEQINWENVNTIDVQQAAEVYALHPDLQE